MSYRSTPRMKVRCTQSNAVFIIAEVFISVAQNRSSRLAVAEGIQANQSIAQTQ